MNQTLTHFHNLWQPQCGRPMNSMPVGDFEFTPGQNSTHHSRESSELNRPKPIHFNDPKMLPSNTNIPSNGDYYSQYSPSYADISSPARRIDTPNQNSTFVFPNDNRWKYRSILLISIPTLIDTEAVRSWQRWRGVAPAPSRATPESNTTKKDGTF